MRIKKFCLALSILSIVSCNKSITINTFDLSRGYGIIKISNKNSSEKTYELGTKIAEEFKSKESYKAKYYQFSFEYNSKNKPVQCLYANITYNQSKFYIEQVQTHYLNGEEISEAFLTYIYYDGTKLYQKLGKEESWKVDNSMAINYIEKAKPKLIMHVSSSADYRSGRNSNFNFVEQMVISQNEVIRFIAKNNDIKYYYEMVITNKFFQAYEFEYPSDGQAFNVLAPDGLPN